MKSDYRYILMICCAISFLVGPGSDDETSEEKSATMHLVRKHGYPLEIHNLTTEDGYILTMFRIPYGKHGGRKNRKPILLMHGMYGNAENFLMNAGNNGSLAFALADENYDVWLGNSRGNQHGMRHKYLDPRSRDFWDFSFHEIGVYDIPATIDYILEATDHEKLHYVAHSQGGTSFYVMCSTRPEYQQKINLASLLAPVAYQKHFQNPFLLPFTTRHEKFVNLAEMLNIFQLPPRGFPLSRIISKTCENSVVQGICSIVYSIVVGDNLAEFDQDLVPIAMRFFPSASTKQLLHFSQTIATEKFQPWDYGEEKNLRTYGSHPPPIYDIGKIHVPTAVFYSQGDNLAYAKDVESLCDDLQNCVGKFRMSNSKWTHMDFLIAKNARKHLIDPLIQFIQEYSFRNMSQSEFS